MNKKEKEIPILKNKIRDNVYEGIYRNENVIIKIYDIDIGGLGNDYVKEMEIVLYNNYI